MPLRVDRRFFAICVGSALLGLSGCKSAFVEAIVRNETASPISLIEVDYPTASFGRASLSPHEEFHYRFKILGSGGTRIQWTDAHRQDHSTAGPELHEGQQGTLRVAVGETTARWEPELK